MTAAVFAGFLASAAAVMKDPITKPKRYISPVPLGDQSGDDWDNAAPLSSINTQIQRARQIGGEVVLRADIGVYNQPGAISISQGGASPADPVVIRGVSVGGADMMAELVGNRADPWVIGSANGSDVFRLNVGANNLTWRFIRHRNQGRGCFRIRQPISNLTIEDCEAFNVNTWLANDGVTSTADATVTGLFVRRCYVKGFSKCFTRLMWDSNNILFEDCEGDSDRQDRDNFATGIKFDHTAHDIVVRRCKMGNIIDTYSAYQNGDGFASERGNYNLLFEDCVAHNCTDGGWDCKSDNIIIRRCQGIENHRNFRLWGYALLEDCISIEPKDNAGFNGYAQYHFAGYSSSLVRCVNCRAEATTSKATVFTAENGGMISYDSDCTWSIPAGAAVTFAEGGSNGDPAGFVGQKPNVSTPPVITSPSNYSTDENIAARWMMTSDRTAQLRVVGGRDKAKFSTFGRQLRMTRQDYEALPDPNLQIDIQMTDLAGNVSATKALSIAIQDVNDDPITPAILFGSGGASDGVWFELQPGFCFTDAAGLYPCQEGDEIIRINDQSGHGHHAIAYDPANPMILRNEADRWYGEATGGLTCYKIGGNGSLSFPVVTAVICHRRDPVDMNPRTLFTIPRYFTPDVANNHRFRMYFAANSGTNFGASFNGTNYYTDSTTASPIGRDAVLSARSAPAIVRGGGVTLRDGTDVTALIYASNGPAILGAKSTGDESMVGRLYGFVATNREEGDAMNYRIERQLALLASMNL